MHIRIKLQYTSEELLFALILKDVDVAGVKCCSLRCESCCYRRKIELLPFERLCNPLVVCAARVAYT